MLTLTQKKQNTTSLDETEAFCRSILQMAFLQPCTEGLKKYQQKLYNRSHCIKTQSVYFIFFK